MRRSLMNSATPQVDKMTPAAPPARAMNSRRFTMRPSGRAPDYSSISYSRGRGSGRRIRLRSMTEAILPDRAVSLRCRRFHAF